MTKVVNRSKFNYPSLSDNQFMQRGALQEFENIVDGLFSFENGRSRMESFPSCDIHANEEGFILSFDIPGVKKDDISIEINAGDITVSGKRELVKDGVSSSERWTGSFKRSFKLPDHCDLELIEAHHEDGVLQIAIPKSEKEAPKTISINKEKTGVLEKLLGSSKSKK